MARRERWTGRALSHECRWPGCRVWVSRECWGCHRHWFRLPIGLRDAIWSAYRPGQGVDRAPSAAWIAADRAARAWALEERKRAHADGQLNLFPVESTEVR